MIIEGHQLGFKVFVVNFYLDSHSTTGHNIHLLKWGPFNKNFKIKQSNLNVDSKQIPNTK